MPSAYSLSPRRARIVRVVAALFLVVAAACASITVAAAVRPGLAFTCGPSGCVDRTSLIDLAPEDARPALRASGEAQAAFAGYVARPSVRAALAGVQLLAQGPFAALMLLVGLALRRLAARGGEDLAQALPWLRRASFAALLLAVSAPLSRSLHAMLLYPGTPSGPTWYFEVDGRRLIFDLLLALAAFAVVWALDAGSRAERDVAAFV